MFRAILHETAKLTMRNSSSTLSMATELLYAIRAERARVSIRAGELIVTSLRADKVTRYLTDLPRVLAIQLAEFPAEALHHYL